MLNTLILIKIRLAFFETNLPPTALHGKVFNKNLLSIQEISWERLSAILHQSLHQYLLKYDRVAAILGFANVD